MIQKKAVLLKLKSRFTDILTRSSNLRKLLKSVQELKTIVDFILLIFLSL